MDRLFIFTMKDCEHCSLLKERLEKENIEFSDLDIVLFEEEWNEVVKQTNQNIVPTIFLKDKKGKKGNVFLPNIDFEDVDGAIKIINEKI